MKRAQYISHCLFHYKTLKSQNQNRFNKITNKYNFLKSQTNPKIYKSYIHTINFHRKKVIKQVNT